MTLLEFIVSWFDKRREHQVRLRELEYDYERESHVCQSCEALKLELAKAHDMNRELLMMVQPKPTGNVKIETPTEFKPILPNHRSWKVKQQALEENSRHNARIIQDKVKEELELAKSSIVKPIPEIVVLTEPITVESIEKELGVTDVNESVSAAS